jgi:hypothetical protein
MRKKEIKSEVEWRQATLTFLSRTLTTLFMGIFNFFFILILSQHAARSRTKREVDSTREFIGFRLVDQDYRSLSVLGRFSLGSPTRDALLCVTYEPPFNVM